MTSAHPIIEGLFETHINVRNLEQSMDFYGQVLGLELAHLEEQRRIAFYWIGGRGQAMLGLWETPPEEVATQHFAFRTSLEKLHLAAAYLRERQLTGYNFLGDGTDVPMVFGWMPALALYFRDPDGHSLEFITMLEGQPRPELGVISLEAWEALQQD
ncbi:VOC family protein [Deinococcus cellulosilyticus]|uniref:Glyoxalase n=1 Tax=Deinococcus cellulosilyticus (strain DSM 18568 / NBRC 106333 / KACC 11606 / 5516J-15) TaxID=1223518 RepID=A0A511MY35_DEIC1|nr:VOC family protein [Deinococcus cellulosilyticus]GEM45500.1 glyoxalase [Deinococcus cellulosilyticus NBRC 106333 = KACC 11606]